MASVETNYDYVASLCEASSALRSENVQLRQERDEARAERDQLTLRLAKITAELALVKSERDGLTNGLSSLLHNAVPSFAKRTHEMLEETDDVVTKRLRAGSHEESQPYALGGVVETLPEQEEEEDEPESEAEVDCPVQQWVQSQERIFPKTIDLHQLQVQDFRKMFLTNWPENGPLEAKFQRLLNWAFKPSYHFEGMLKTFDQYACWSFGRVTESSGPCPWARTVSFPFSCKTDHARGVRVSDCAYCNNTNMPIPGLCMWLCHSKVDTGYPERDNCGIMRKRGDAGRKVADKHDWRSPRRLTESIGGKEIRWIVHLYGCT